MKKILLLAGVLVATSVFANEVTPVAQQQQQSTSTSQSDASNAGNNQTVTGPTIVVNTAAPDTRSILPPQTINQNISQSGDTTTRMISGGTQTIKNTPSVGGPPLTSSNDTCMGSASASINAPGIGLALGKTYTDANCVMLKNSRELWNMGMKAASLALMCTDAANREALELTGFECPQTTKARQEKRAAPTTATSSSDYTGSDPFVRARLGLPPLK